MFSRFFKKKEEPSYDSTNLTVQDLKPGFIFEYDLRNWEIVESNMYDWGNEYFSTEHKITDGKDVRYLEVEEDDLMISQDFSTKKIEANLIEEYTKNQALPKKIVADSEKFVLDEESPGYYGRGLDPQDWSEVIRYSYYSKKDPKKYLCIEQFGDKEFEATIGYEIENFEISRINPV
jgi:hypothetical protein